MNSSYQRARSVMFFLFFGCACSAITAVTIAQTREDYRIALLKEIGSQLHLMLRGKYPVVVGLDAPDLRNTRVGFAFAEAYGWAPILAQGEAKEFVEVIELSMIDEGRVFLGFYGLGREPIRPAADLPRNLAHVKKAASHGQVSDKSYDLFYYTTFSLAEFGFAQDQFPSRVDLERFYRNLLKILQIWRPEIAEVEAEFQGELALVSAKPSRFSDPVLIFAVVSATLLGAAATWLARAYLLFTAETGLAMAVQGLAIQYKVKVKLPRMWRFVFTTDAAWLAVSFLKQYAELRTALARQQFEADRLRREREWLAAEAARAVALEEQKRQAILEKRVRERLEFDSLVTQFLQITVLKTRADPKALRAYKRALGETSRLRQVRFLTAAVELQREANERDRESERKKDRSRRV